MNHLKIYYVYMFKLAVSVSFYDSHVEANCGWV